MKTTVQAFSGRFGQGGTRLAQEGEGQGIQRRHRAGLRRLFRGFGAVAAGMSYPGEVFRQAKGAHSGGN